jgi:hypothetical protein
MRASALEPKGMRVDAAPWDGEADASAGMESAKDIKSTAVEWETGIQRGLEVAV